MKVPVHRTAELKSVPPTELSRDWFGQSCTFNPRFKFGLWEQRLTFWFAADKPPECDLELKPGNFQAGLWEQDVAEFFLLGPGGEYQEFNVSPTGAWWSGFFTSYRSPAQECPSLSVETSSGWSDADWWAELSVPIGELAVNWEASVRVNPASILSPSQPRYFCFGHVEGGEPDFHLASNFCTIELC